MPLAQLADPWRKMNTTPISEVRKEMPRVLRCVCGDMCLWWRSSVPWLAVCKLVSVRFNLLIFLSIFSGCRRCDGRMQQRGSLAFFLLIFGRFVSKLPNATSRSFDELFVGPWLYAS